MFALRHRRYSKSKNDCFAHGLPAAYFKREVWLYTVPPKRVFKRLARRGAWLAHDHLLVAKFFQVNASPARQPMRDRNDNDKRVLSIGHVMKPGVGTVLCKHRDIRFIRQQAAHGFL